jgi:DNA repair exonuclease SbcCD ATPase subunit
MKKFQLMMLSVAAAAVLVGCGGSNSGTTEIKQEKIDNLGKNLKDIQVELNERENASECQAGGCDAELATLRTKISILESELAQEEARAQAAAKTAQEAQDKLASMQGCTDCYKLKIEELRKLVAAYSENSDLTDAQRERLLKNDESISSLIENIINEYNAAKATKKAVDEETTALDEKIEDGLDDFDNMTDAEEAAFIDFLTAEANKILEKDRETYDKLKAQLDSCKATAKVLQEDAEAKAKVYEELVEKAGKGANAANEIIALEAAIKAKKEEIAAKASDIAADGEITDAEVEEYDKLKKECVELVAEKEKQEKTKCENNVTIDDVLAAKKASDEAAEKAATKSAECAALEGDVAAARAKVDALEEKLAEDLTVKANAEAVAAAIEEANEAKRDKAAEDLADAEEQKDLADKLDAIINPVTTGASGASS